MSFSNDPPIFTILGCLLFVQIFASLIRNRTEINSESKRSKFQATPSRPASTPKRVQAMPSSWLEPTTTNNQLWKTLLKEISSNAISSSNQELFWLALKTFWICSDCRVFCLGGNNTCTKGQLKAAQLQGGKTKITMNHLKLWKCSCITPFTLTEHVPLSHSPKKQCNLYTCFVHPALVFFHAFHEMLSQFG